VRQRTPQNVFDCCSIVRVLTGVGRLLRWHMITVADIWPGPQAEAA
jgi:hypothetical protein